MDDREGRARNLFMGRVLCTGEPEQLGLQGKMEFVSRRAKANPLWRFPAPSIPQFVLHREINYRGGKVNNLHKIKTL